jgi:hypothetical protein
LTVAIALAVSLPAGAQIFVPGYYPTINSRAQTYTTATLPAAGQAGRLVFVTDGLRGFYMDTGTTWVKLSKLDVRLFGAKCDNSNDDTTAFQAAVTAIQGSGNGGVVYVPGDTAQCKTTDTVTISANAVRFEGDGQRLSRVRFAPTVDGKAAFVFDKGAAVTMVQNGFTGISIYGTGDAHQKIALNLVDIEEFELRDVGIQDWTNAAKTCIGLWTQGRQALDGQRLTFNTDRPYLLGKNTHLANGFLSGDHFHFQDTYWIAHTSQPVVEIESGAMVSNLTFDGHNAWVLGQPCIKWIDTTATLASNSVTFQGVRCEQQTDVAQYLVDVELNQNLHGLTFRDFYGGIDAKGWKLRKVRQASFVNVLYTNATSREALNLDNTVFQFSCTSCFWQSGTTASLTGQRFLGGGNYFPSTGALPAHFLLDSTDTATTTGVREINEGYLSGKGFTVIKDADTVVGYDITNVPAAFLLIIADTNVSAFIALRGSTHSVNILAFSDAGHWSTTAGNAGTNNVYWDAGSSRYRLQNKTAGDRKYNYTIIGTIVGFPSPWKKA